MKRIIAIILSFAMLLPFVSMNAQAVDLDNATLSTEDEVTTEYCDDSATEPVAMPDDVLWTTNEDGIAETQEILYLPDDGSLPNYITGIEYQDASNLTHIDEEFPTESEIYIPAGEGDSTVYIPLQINLAPGNEILTDEITLTEPIEAAMTHIQIYDSENDTAILDADFPIFEAERITLSEGKEYWISLVNDYGEYFDSYYGTIAVSAGTIEITGGWHFTTNKEDLITTESGIEFYSTTMNEKEPNDSQYTATVYENDADMYGTIAKTSDIDYFKVTFGRDGKANFYLGNIPKDCNYDMKIYYQSVSGGTLTLYRTLSTSGSYEQVLNLPVESNKVYYMQVYSSKGSSVTEKYQVRAKITPTDDNYEPNNSFETARSISTYGSIDATIHKSTDVDYYVVNCSSNGVLDITLSNIPYGCDYRFVVYDSYRNQIAETATSGNGNKSLSVAISYGKYFLKIYSRSGSNETTKYRLKTTTRTSSMYVNGYIHPYIKPAGNAAHSYTTIANLPIQIIYAPRNNMSAQRVVTTATTNSLGKFSASFSLPNDTGRLFVKIYPSDSTLSVRTLDNTVPTLLYEIPFNAANISFDTTDRKDLTDQMLVSMSLWRLGKNALAIYPSKGNYSCKQLVLCCTAGKECTTASSNDYINVNGLSSEQDYYDYEVLLHEMGHWVMRNMGGRPNGDGVKHTWSTASSPFTAYIEGWAHYFSCSMRNTSTLNDYRSTGSYIGGNLDTGYVVGSYGGSPSKPTQSDYIKNMSYEVFVACALWNLSDDIGTSYRSMESIMRYSHKDWQEFYDAYMDTIPTTNRKAAWKVCEEFKVAFDMEKPNVSVTISNLIANMNATDNISVETYDWYVDGKKVGSGTGSSGSLNLKTLDLTPGSHTVECRAYDPEGLAKGNRPRTDRYGSASKNFVIYDVVAVGVDNIEMNLPMNEDAVESQLNWALLPLGADYSYTVDTFGNMDIAVSLSASNAVKSIDIYAPNHELYESLPYIAPDAPYVIKDARPGEWLIKITNYSADELQIIAYDQGDDMAYTKRCSFPATEIQINVNQIPTVVDIDAPSFSSNPYILAELFCEDSIIVTENEEPVDVSMPLPDGMHEFTVIRQIDGVCSESTKYIITVDTVIPEITFVDLPISTGRDRFLLQVEFSEDVASITVNGEELDVGSCGRRSSYTAPFMLEPGLNWFTLTVTDYAGNSNYQTFSVEQLT